MLLTLSLSILNTLFTCYFLKVNVDIYFVEHRLVGMMIFVDLCGIFFGHDVSVSPKHRWSGETDTTRSCFRRRLMSTYSLRPTQGCL